MLDEDLGDAEGLPDFEEVMGEGLGLLLIEPGGGLVQQKQRRLHAERPAQLHALLHPIR